MLLSAGYNGRLELLNNSMYLYLLRPSIICTWKLLAAGKLHLTRLVFINIGFEVSDSK